MELEEIKKQIRIAPYEEAIKVLSEYIKLHPDSDEALTARGLKHWGAGKRADAIRDYLAAIRLNPASRAREALRAAGEILDYRNTDLYNP